MTTTRTIPWLLCLALALCLPAHAAAAARSKPAGEPGNRKVAAGGQKGGDKAGKNKDNKDEPLKGAATDEEGGAAAGPFGIDAGDAERIVFVCDATASMAHRFDDLKAGLRRAVEGLPIEKTFVVVFIKNDNYLAFLQPGAPKTVPTDRALAEMRARTIEGNKARFAAWLNDKVVSGTGNPVAALEFGMKEDPDVVYFATGDAAQAKAVSARLKELNAGGRAKVHAVAFPPKKGGQALSKLMKSIAAGHGGESRVVADPEKPVELARPVKPPEEPDGWAPAPDEPSDGPILGRGVGTVDGRPATNPRGKLAPFGTPGGGTPGPRGKVFGNGGNARTVAFVCDASASLAQPLPELKAELIKTIEALKPVQSFSVVFLGGGGGDDGPRAFQEGRLVPATGENKRAFGEWVAGVEPVERTDPLPALELAFKSKPQLLYFLTDKGFADNDKVVARTAALNKAKTTKVNTVAFYPPTKEATDESRFEALTAFLIAMAKQNGGQFRALIEEDGE